MDDVFVHLTPLPGRVKEAITPNADGSYSIFIRDDLSREEQLRVYAHARRHIENLDFENRTEKNVQVLEAKAHEED